MLTVIKSPINSTDRHEHANNVDAQDLELPWATLLALLKDKDFLSVHIVTTMNSYIITKDSSW